jgi:hypothetical protein
MSLADSCLKASAGGGDNSGYGQGQGQGGFPGVQGGGGGQGYGGGQGGGHGGGQGGGYQQWQQMTTTMPVAAQSCPTQMACPPPPMCPPAMTETMTKIMTVRTLVALSHSPLLMVRRQL